MPRFRRTANGWPISRTSLDGQKFTCGRLSARRDGDGRRQSQISTAGGIMPAWRSDGKELYYVNPAGELMAAPIAITKAALEPGNPVRLFPTRIVFGGGDVQQWWRYDVASDGRFLINMEVDSVAPPITLLTNWNPEAKQSSK